MKKILTLLTSIGLVSSGMSNVVSCNSNEKSINVVNLQFSSEPSFDDLSNAIYNNIGMDNILSEIEGWVGCEEDLVYENKNLSELHTGITYDELLAFCLVNQPKDLSDWDKGIHLIFFLQNWDKVDKNGIPCSDSVMIDILEYEINISKG